jgi:hypothetical protein
LERLRLLEIQGLSPKFSWWTGEGKKKEKIKGKVTINQKEVGEND